MTNQHESILVIDPLPVAESGEPTLAARRLPVEALRTGMTGVLSEVSEMFRDAQKALGSCKVEHVEISLAISADGSIGLLGSSLGTGAKGAIKMKLIFSD